MKIPDMDHYSIIGHLGNDERIKRAEEYLIQHAIKVEGPPI